MEPATTASVQPGPAVQRRGLATGHGRTAQERPGMMTDGEIAVELKTATGDRLADLLRERAERREYRASMRLPGASA